MEIRPRISPWCSVPTWLIPELAALPCIYPSPTKWDESLTFVSQLGRRPSPCATRIAEESESYGLLPFSEHDSTCCFRQISFDCDFPS